VDPHHAVSFLERNRTGAFVYSSESHRGSIIALRVEIGPEAPTRTRILGYRDSDTCFISSLPVSPTISLLLLLLLRSPWPRKRKVGVAYDTLVTLTLVTLLSAASDTLL